MLNAGSAQTKTDYRVLAALQMSYRRPRQVVRAFRKPTRELRECLWDYIGVYSGIGSEGMMELRSETANPVLGSWRKR